MSNTPPSRSSRYRARRSPPGLRLTQLSMSSPKQPLQGNALAVFCDARGLIHRGDAGASPARRTSRNNLHPPSRRRQIERERGVQVRIFTVREELPFAGHPTLGTASWLYLNHPTLRGRADDHARPARRPIPVTFTRQQSGHGVFGTMRQNDPVFGEVHDRAASRARHRPHRRRPRPRPAHPDRLHWHAVLHRSAALARSRSAARHSASTRRSRISRAPTQSSSTASPAPMRRPALTGTRACSSTTEKIRQPVPLPAAPSLTLCAMALAASDAARSSSNRASRCCVPAAFTSRRRAMVTACANVCVGGRTIPIATGRFFLP